jgi:hypothetical protein
MKAMGNIINNADMTILQNHGLYIAQNVGKEEVKILFQVKTNMKHDESRIQYDICQWLQTNGFFFFSVPNEATGRTAVQQMRLIAMGLRPGAADLVVVLPGSVVFMEVKDETGTQSKQQINFQEKVQSLGHKYFIVRSVEDVKNLLDSI